jgi:hypothetical protein
MQCSNEAAHKPADLAEHDRRRQGWQHSVPSAIPSWRAVASSLVCHAVGKRTVGGELAVFALTKPGGRAPASCCHLRADITSRSCTSGSSRSGRLLHDVLALARAQCLHDDGPGTSHVTEGCDGQVRGERDPDERSDAACASAEGLSKATIPAFGEARETLALQIEGESVGPVQPYEVQCTINGARAESLGACKDERWVAVCWDATLLVFVAGSGVPLSPVTLSSREHEELVGP